jgi:hypothetical protein
MSFATLLLPVFLVKTDSIFCPSDYEHSTHNHVLRLQYLKSQFVCSVITQVLYK